MSRLSSLQCVSLFSPQWFCFDPYYVFLPIAKINPCSIRLSLWSNIWISHDFSFYVTITVYQSLFFPPYVSEMGFHESVVSLVFWTNAALLCQCLTFASESGSECENADAADTQLSCFHMRDTQRLAHLSDSDASVLPYQDEPEINARSLKWTGIDLPTLSTVQSSLKPPRCWITSPQNKHLPPHV